MSEVELNLSLDQNAIEDAVSNCSKTPNDESISVCSCAKDCLELLLKNANINTYDKAIDFNEFVGMRAIFIDDIDSCTSNSVVSTINFWNEVDKQNSVPKEQRKPIIININSDGGTISSGFTIIDAIKSSVTPVYTINIGKAYSCGFLIFICGQKRLSYKNSSFLVHEGSVNIGGADAGKFQNFSDFYKVIREKIKNLVLENTGISDELYSKHINNLISS